MSNGPTGHGTPFSTIKIIAQDLLEQFKDDINVKKDLQRLLASSCTMASFGNSGPKFKLEI